MLISKIANIVGVVFSLLLLILQPGCVKMSENRDELTKVIDHFENEGNKEKVEAAKFVVSNLEGSFYITSNPDFKSFFTFLDSLHANNVPLRAEGTTNPAPLLKEKWENKYKQDVQLNYKIDKDEISPDFLISNINQAYHQWKTNPWKEQVSFENFCDFVLPYNVMNEEFNPEWRGYFVDKYKKVIDSLRNQPDMVNVTRYINNDVGKSFQFNTLLYQYPLPMSFPELIQAKVGTCPQMVTISAYALRALGIPVAVDYTPQFGNHSARHFWLTLMSNNGNEIPFNAAGDEWLPFGYVICTQTRNFKLPKVHRKTFSIQKQNEPLINSKQEFPAVFSDRKYLDVTDLYMPTADVKVDLKENRLNKKFAFLCVFNNSSWVPVEWAKIHGGIATFENMGKGICYLPAFFDKNKIISAADPFILNEAGEAIPLKKFNGKAQTVKLKRKYPQNLTEKNDTTNGILATDLYHLYYWDSIWISLGKRRMSDNVTALDLVGFDFPKEEFDRDVGEENFLLYPNIPVGSLYLLKNETRGREERIFTLKEGEQIWW